MNMLWKIIKTLLFFGIVLYCILEIADCYDSNPDKFADKISRKLQLWLAKTFFKAAKVAVKSEIKHAMSH